MAKVSRHKRIVRGKLGDRDFDILEHIARYRMTTAEVLLRLFFEDSKINAVYKVMSKLRSRGFVAAEDFFDGGVYYRLAKNGLIASGISVKRDKHLGSQALAEHYAKLLFCCDPEQPRTLLQVSEIQKRFPYLLAAGMLNRSYYIDHEMAVGKEVIGFIRPDFGGTLPRLVDGLLKPYQQRCSDANWQRVINAGLFGIRVVTFSDERAIAIQGKFTNRSVPFHIRISAYRELMPLLTGEAL